ncbi:MAG TPA: T9SS type A sorting domain-containing protein [Phaeodactylibacter sp.]|nr:T9SS type A sorting domain-containing protein [Phaeodactylibacter sp.]
MFSVLRFVLLLLLCSPFFPARAQVFWSETFDNNAPELPPGWVTFSNSSGDGVWQVTNIGPDGNYPTAPLNEPSTDNYWIIFDSDLDCSHDQDAWIRSDAIDCSDKEIVWIHFQQLYRNFYCETYLRMTDNINTPLDEWEEIPLNIVEVNEYGEPEILMDISDYAAGVENFYLAFEFRNVAGQSPEPGLDGCAYNWQIDSILLYGQNPLPYHDLALSNNFFAIAPNALTPQSQVETFGFLCDVINLGQSVQTGGFVNLDIVDAATEEVVHNEVFDFADNGILSIAPGEIVENQLFPAAGFLASPEIKTYLGRYIIGADSTDQSPQDNEAVFTFETTSNTFAKEDTSNISILPTPDNWEDGEPYSWAFGNHYYLPNGDTWFATEVSFALGNPNMVAGKKLKVHLFEWTDIVLGSPTAIAPNQRTEVGFNEYTITGNEMPGALITVDLLDIFSGEKGVALHNAGHYLLMLSYEAIDQSIPVAIAGSDLRDYGAQIYRAEQLGQARYAGLLMFGDISSEPFSTVGFGRYIVPTIRMKIEKIDALKPTIPIEQIVQISPNPAHDFLHIALEMPKPTPEVRFSIFHESGNLVRYNMLQDVKKGRLSFDLKDLPKGNYFLQVETEAGRGTMSFVIQ